MAKIHIPFAIHTSFTKFRSFILYVTTKYTCLINVPYTWHIGSYVSLVFLIYGTTHF